MVGREAIAGTLGTAAGFIAQGISYALSEMVEDTVAGVYLLGDPDFNPGDCQRNRPQKSRFELDGVGVLANRSVESEWTLRQGDE